MTAKEKIDRFLDEDMEKLSEIIEKYPFQIPIAVVAELFGCQKETLSMAIEEQGLLGICERRPGKLNRGFVIPTAHFLRWYMCWWRV